MPGSVRPLCRRQGNRPAAWSRIKSVIAGHWLRSALSSCRANRAASSSLQNSATHCTRILSSPCVSPRSRPPCLAFLFLGRNDVAERVHDHLSQSNAVGAAQHTKRLRTVTKWNAEFATWPTGQDLAGRCAEVLMRIGSPTDRDRCDRSSAGGEAVLRPGSASGRRWWGIGWGPRCPVAARTGPPPRNDNRANRPRTARAAVRRRRDGGRC